MLAHRREVKLNGQTIAETPLLVPAFSSKGFPDVRAEAAAIFSEVVLDSVLVSAYDVYYTSIGIPADFTGIVFLDSGGYEVSKEHEALDWRHYAYSPASWDSYHHLDVVDAWPAHLTTVMISYDHPSRRLPLADQVDAAKKLFARCPGVSAEILVKPERLADRYVDVTCLETHADLLSGFDVIGIADKELGPTTRNRVVNIARIRKALSAAGVESPIHVLGSLDTLIASLYFLAGADIFDGLSWLRFRFTDGQATYMLPSGAAAFGMERSEQYIRLATMRDNIYYLADMQWKMATFVREQDFAIFGRNSEFLRRESSCLASV